MSTPSLLRRLGSLLYDTLVFIALWLLASALFTTIYGSVAESWQRWLLQLFCLAVISSYFLWCWTHGGQTLAMRTWRIHLIDASGSAPSLSAAVKRCLLATVGLLLGGIGLWWALLDRNGQFLHDRLAGTRLVMSEKIP
ncbi:MAG TPA: RDD family protein [Methylophilaceae bacterium]|nr:RDD family protein [Methylophilaceae bacterium]